MSSSGGARTNDVADSRRLRGSLARSLTTLLPPRDGTHQFYRHNQIYRDGAAINFYPVFNTGRNSRRATPRPARRGRDPGICRGRFHGPLSNDPFFERVGRYSRTFAGITFARWSNDARSSRAEK